MLELDKHDPTRLTVDELVAENEDLRGRLRQLEQADSDRRRVENELRENADNYLSILEDMPDTYYRVDTEGRVEFAFQTVFELLGYTLGEMKNRRLSELFEEPDGRDRFMAALIENGGRLHDYRVRQRCRNGELIWVSISARLRHDANGVVIGSQGTSRDVTLQREAEEALRLSEERYSLAVTAINDGIWDIDLVTGEFYQSSRWYEMLGFR